MTDYRKLRVPGASWFFTVALAERGRDHLLIECFPLLRTAFSAVRQSRPFRLDAAVVLPEHLHCIWTLPADDADFTTRWRLIKAFFSRGLRERPPPGRPRSRARELWQRRCFSRLLVDDAEFRSHVDYIHWNPVKHGHVVRARDWEYSSFRHFVERGVYTPDWGDPAVPDLDAGE